MEPINKIDYSKFLCEVYSPNGKLLQVARFNGQNDFYCSGLVTGQSYYLVFSYDKILLECMAYNCTESGKVVYLSPAHVIFNRSAEVLPLTVINAIKDKIENRQELNVPDQRWANYALSAFEKSAKTYSKKMISQGDPLAFKVGTDFKV